MIVCVIVFSSRCFNEEQNCVIQVNWNILIKQDVLNEKNNERLYKRQKETPQIIKRVFFYPFISAV